MLNYASQTIFGGCSSSQSYLNANESSNALGSSMPDFSLGMRGEGWRQAGYHNLKGNDPGAPGSGFPEGAALACGNSCSSPQRQAAASDRKCL